MSCKPAYYAARQTPPAVPVGGEDPCLPLRLYPPAGCHRGPNADQAEPVRRGVHCCWPDHPRILRLQRQRQHLSNFFHIGNSSGPFGRVMGGASAPPFNFERRVL